MTATLFLRLEGPLQSWGERARWTVRDTAPEPTKSAVIGLLGCALGLRKDQDLRQLSANLKMGVRCDRPGAFLVDFHTVVGGAMAAEGKIKVNATTKQPETIVSHRSYLSDASFLVALQSADAFLIDRISQAVQSPHWPIYLGRKSCVPSRPIYAGRGDFPDILSALQTWPLHSTEPKKSYTVRVVLECDPAEGIRRRDEVDVPSLRTFLPRYICEQMVTLQSIMED